MAAEATRSNFSDHAGAESSFSGSPPQITDQAINAAVFVFDLAGRLAVIVEYLDDFDLAYLISGDQHCILQNLRSYVRGAATSRNRYCDAK